MKHLFKVVAVGLSGLLLIACSSVAGDRVSEMNDAASALTKLSAAVDGTIRYGEPSPLLSESDLLAMSVADDPSLLTPLQNFILRVRREGDDSSVLVCDLHGTMALLEDAGCTPALDTHHWHASPAAPCHFTFSPRSICTQYIMSHMPR